MVGTSTFFVDVSPVGKEDTGLGLDRMVFRCIVSLVALPSLSPDDKILFYKKRVTSLKPLFSTFLYRGCGEDDFLSVR